ncbi:TetR family transcriptional regulator [Isoptericola sp. 4D.3]|jgi:AcrR family transcriptional regulator|uniref:TetR family transcriptional regulator n=1 Tax=Isoptericola peretonis TaxID=2918523 RepID=A0ABT0J4X3_9MICO|nr:TetR family transcriptional regulator [Isoptericola sp. 4D.3]
MRSVDAAAEDTARPSGPVVPTPDGSTRGRILDAAMLRFARSGFGASVRSIAADAGVSAALVIHHFGSKDKLHEATDEYVLTWIREVKRQSIGLAAGGNLLQVLAAADQYAPLVGYVLRSLQAGGAVGREFTEHMIADAQEYTSEAVREGVLRPSRDEAARVRYLVYSSLGAMLLSVTLDPPRDPEDVSAAMRRFMDELYLPMLELFTEGFLTTRRMLDDYLLYVPDPPAGAQDPADGTPTHDEEEP